MEALHPILDWESDDASWFLEEENEDIDEQTAISGTKNAELLCLWTKAEIVLKDGTVFAVFRYPRNDRQAFCSIMDRLAKNAPDGFNAIRFTDYVK